MIVRLFVDDGFMTCLCRRVMVFYYVTNKLCGWQLIPNAIRCVWSDKHSKSIELGQRNSGHSSHSRRTSLWVVFCRWASHIRAHTQTTINHTSTVSHIRSAGCEELVMCIDEWSAPWQISDQHWSTGQVGLHILQQQHWGTAAQGRVCQLSCSDVNTSLVAAQRDGRRSWRDAGSTGSQTSGSLCIASVYIR